MKQPQRKTRLDDFLEAYQPLDKALLARIGKRVNGAGLSPDDPNSLQIAHETIIEARLRQHARALYDLPKNIELAVKLALQTAEITDQRNRAAHREEFSQQIAGTVSDVLEAEIPRWERSLHLRMVARLGLTAVLICTIGMTAGYMIGRYDTARLNERYAEMAAQPDAGTWLHLQSVNGNLDEVLSNNCRPGQAQHIKTQDGQEACAVPLWLDAPEAPRPITTIQKAHSQFVSLRARLPFTIILLLGISVGIVASAGWHRIFKS